MSREIQRYKKLEQTKNNKSLMFFYYAFVLIIQGGVFVASLFALTIEHQVIQIIGIFFGFGSFLSVPVILSDFIQTMKNYNTKIRRLKK